ncbi:MAG: hypothetical protein IPP71_16320 [Bacteroidetes bacterium]|nr:hypothetical protein [Bacteroidota bacterium]
MKFSIKSFLLTAFVLIELSLSCVLAKPNELNIAPDENNFLIKPKLSICITIARRRDCDGFGICDISVSGRATSGNKANGVLYQDDVSKNTLVLQVNKLTDVTTECYNKYFKSGSFIMEDDFPMPLEISRSLEFSGQKTIPSGKHRIVEINGIIYVYLPVK